MRDGNVTWFLERDTATASKRGAGCATRRVFGWKTHVCIYRTQYNMVQLM